MINKNNLSAGFSLIGVLVGVAAVSVLSLTVMTIIDNSVRSQALTRSKQAAANLQLEMLGLLSSRSICTLNFKGVRTVPVPDSITNIKSAAAVVALQEGAAYDNNAITISNIRVTNFKAYSNVAPDNYRGTAELALDVSPRTAGINTMVITRIVKLSVDLNGTSANPPDAISSCVAVGNSQNDIWKFNNAGNAIYYSGFNVGIGTDAPVQMLTVQGDIYAQSYLHVSDRRQKTEITKAPGLAVIEQLQGVRFRWRKSNQPSYGVIAQDVEKVMPEAVFTDPRTNLKSVDYDQLIAPIIESVKELERENLELRRSLETLRAKR